ncbi:hypothetical protein PMZ80_000019 [Knufia obscura]|uniref:Uncharacterized protein n=1 Tax=Knufia obscura TaxID=1635080 RepID=A0ABR0RZ71_9EURO|nr:hypothetical protein PMZ80_000019 [Knufia obscura]
MDQWGRSSEYFLRLGYRTNYLPEEINKFSALQTFDCEDIDEAGNGWNGRHEPISPLTKPRVTSSISLPFSTFPYSALLPELRAIVLKQLFTTCRYDLGVHDVVTIYENEHACSWPGRDCYEKLCSTQYGGLGHRSHTWISFPHDFMQLFASKQCYAEAFPVFAENTSVDLTVCEAFDLMTGIRKYPRLTSILATMLFRTPHIQARDMSLSWVPNTIQTLSMYAYKLQKIDVYTEDEFHWRVNYDEDGDEDGFIMSVNYEDSFSRKHHTITIEEAADCAQTPRYPNGLQDTLKESLFERTRFRNVRKLRVSLQRLLRSVKVHFWLTLVCKILDPALDGQRDKYGITPLGEEPRKMLLVIDAATLDMVDFKLDVGGQLHWNFANGAYPRPDGDEANIDFCMKGWQTARPVFASADYATPNVYHSHD